MSLPNTPFWTITHIAIKFPIATLATISAFLFYQNDSAPLIAITFDDGRKSVLNVALPYMNDKNVVATAYLNVDSFSFDDYINAEDVSKFADAGWEIGSHGFSHVDMTVLEEELLTENLSLSQNILKELSNQVVPSFASPYGAYNDNTIEKVKDFYNTHVNAINGWNEESGMNYIETFNPMLINRIDITSDVSSKMVCDKIATLQKNTLFVMLFHNIAKVESKYSTDPETFREIIDCVAKSSAENVTITEAAARMTK